MPMPLWQKAARMAAAYSAVFVCALMGWWFWNAIPGGENPFQRLYLHHQVGQLTRDKIVELSTDPEWCSYALQVSEMEFTPVEDSSDGEFCGYTNAVEMRRSVTDYSNPVSVTCPMAAALFLWERDILQPLAEEHLGMEVARIEHVGTYSCRRVYGGRTGEPSQHATANAIDVIGFEMSDGSVVSLARHWTGDDERAAFLRDLRDESCRVFSGVLGPEYNAQHADHFHLDLGPYSICS